MKFGMMGLKFQAYILYYEGHKVLMWEQ